MIPVRIKPETENAPTTSNESGLTRTEATAGPRALPTAMVDWASPTRSSGTRDQAAIALKSWGVDIQKAKPHNVSATKKTGTEPLNATAAAQAAIRNTHRPSGLSAAGRRAANHPARALAENAAETRIGSAPMESPIAAAKTNNADPASVLSPRASTKTTFDLLGLILRRVGRNPLNVARKKMGGMNARAMKANTGSAPPLSATIDTIGATTNTVSGPTTATLRIAPELFIALAQDNQTSRPAAEPAKALTTINSQNQGTTIDSRLKATAAPAPPTRYRRLVRNRRPATKVVRAKAPTCADDMSPAVAIETSNSSATAGIRNGVEENRAATDAAAASNPASALARTA